MPFQLLVKSFTWMKNKVCELDINLWRCVTKNILKALYQWELTSCNDVDLLLLLFIANRQ